MISVLRKYNDRSEALLSSRLYDQDLFYSALMRDLNACSSEVIIESPFVTYKRVKELMPILIKLRQRGVRIVINTKDPSDHDELHRTSAYKTLSQLQLIGVIVLYTGGHHRKLAVLDRSILWEGSLNILSQNDSCEIMRRINSATLAKQMLQFIGLERFYKI